MHAPWPTAMRGRGSRGQPMRDLEKKNEQSHSEVTAVTGLPMKYATIQGIARGRARSRGTVRSPNFCANCGKFAARWRAFGGPSPVPAQLRAELARRGLE